MCTKISGVQDYKVRYIDTDYFQLKEKEDPMRKMACLGFLKKMVCLDLIL